MGDNIGELKFRIFSLLNSISCLIQLGCNITQSLYKNSNFFGLELWWLAVYFIRSYLSIELGHFFEVMMNLVFVFHYFL